MGLVCDGFGQGLINLINLINRTLPGMFADHA